MRGEVYCTHDDAELLLSRQALKAVPNDEHLGDLK